MKDQPSQPKPYGAPKWYESMLWAPFAVLGGLALFIATIIGINELLVVFGYISTT